MKSSAQKIKLNSYDDLFAPTPSSADPERENVQELPIAELFPFQNHPFKVSDDAAMQSMAESIKEYGVLMPAVARPLEGGGYELVAGHRRKRGCELAGLDTMPVIVRQMSDDEAIIIMVDSNIQRENILPSERAFAYKLKLDAIRRQGARTDLTSSQVGMKSQALDIVGQQAGDSRNQVHRFIRLTELLPQLLEMVDDKTMSFSPAVELSYLKPEEQTLLLESMESEQATPSLSQAQRMKKFSQEGKLSPDVMSAILSEEKKPEISKVTLTSDQLTKYFPKSYTPQQMESTIIKLLEQWRKRQHSQER